MTDTEINITIAEACGWKERPDPFYADHKAWTHDEGATWVATCDLPDYCHDLNAVHEAWIGLNETHKRIFIDELYAVTPSQIYEDRFVGATARQRAEAFLRAIGKWQG